MNKFAVAMIIILSTYIGGFFLTSPMMILSVNADMPFLSKISQGINHHLYSKWVRDLDNSNLIYKAWVENSMFWCETLPNCTVEPDHDNT